MNDLEFDVVDELYFITSFDLLLNELQLEEGVLRQVLADLYSKGWIRCYEGPVQLIIDSEVNIEKDYRKYHYLATKAGLLAHRSGG